jgi:RNA polymerase sigma factor (sigma-70 family)
MLPRQLLEQNLDLIERTVVRACRRAGIGGADVDEMQSIVRLALVENDYAILRAWEGRSSLATYLAVVVRRLIANEQIRASGRWHASAEAKRHGAVGETIETLVVRRGRAIDEVLPIVHDVDPSITRERVEQIVAQLPPRAPRPRAVELDDGADVVPAPERADARTHEAETRSAAAQTARVVRETLESLPFDDRMLLRLRFGSGMSIADVARMMNVPQRPLYRRIEALLKQLRERLLAAGIDAAALDGIIGSSTVEVDFGWKTGDARQTPSMEGRGS